MIPIADLIGKPYRDNGRGPDAYDCYGLAIEVERRAGYKLNDVQYTDHAPSLCNKYAPTLNVYKLDKPREGALLEMYTDGELHIGVCINEREFIHETKYGARINHIGSIQVRGIYGISTRI